jgi:biotin transport system substrate-specific component
MSALNPVAPLRSAIFPQSTVVTKVGLVLGGTLFLSAMAQIKFAIPGSPVPFTGQTLAVLLLGTAYGASLGLTTITFYILAGIAGAPVFAPKTPPVKGWDNLLGGTGGYLVGMVIATLVIGALAGRRWDQRIRTAIPTMLLGDAIIFLVGVPWLHHVYAMTWKSAIQNGFTNFILIEALKIAIASTALPTVWKFVPKK